MNNSKITPILYKPSYNYYASGNYPVAALSVDFKEMIST